MIFINDHGCRKTEYLSDKIFKLIILIYIECMEKDLFYFIWARLLQLK